MWSKIASKIGKDKSIVNSNLNPVKKKFASISEIPLLFNVSTLFGATGFVSGISLLLIPKHFIQTEIQLPFPHISDNERDYKLIALFLACSTCYGYIGGKVYQFKTFKLGDATRFYKVLGNLVHKTPVALTHCAGFTSIFYYGMFGMFTLFETLIFGKPYGLRPEYYEDHKDQTLSERAKFALELTAHWTQSTIYLVLPMFMFSSCALFISHRSYWLHLFLRLKKPS